METPRRILVGGLSLDDMDIDFFLDDPDQEIVPQQFSVVDDPEDTRQQSVREAVERSGEIGRRLERLLKKN